MVFTEGARTFTGRMTRFKKGAFQMADELQLPVVPLTINGSFDIFPRTGKLLSWHRMELTIHPPIYPNGKGNENIKTLMEESYRAIEESLPEKYRNEADTSAQ